MSRLLAALVVLVAVGLASPALAQWQFDVTATAASAIVNVDDCPNVTFLLFETAGATVTSFPQSCDTNVVATAVCQNLTTIALDGGMVLGYTHGGPLKFVRGNHTLTVGVAGVDAIFQIICTPEND